ncbi:hypothetical protein PANT_9c00392 [Moesziomyces antarcticus T-34]|uniref:Stress response protein rds1p n=1 Tax=Pseudozyma antarctica (strain T-34) TaxID=1151754 RepID=M9LPE2_PSEA3|nr:hypothetical protein PANT_9c00392 [Moesziomyces antarcticus T-34]
MKISPSFVLALAAASSAAGSPVFRRQASSDVGGLPTPVASAASSATGRVSSAVGSATSTGGTASSGASSTFAPSSTSSASPAASTGSSGSSTFNDTQILQYALTLEHLEATFYNQSLSKLSSADFEAAGYNASVRNQIYSIGRDEAAHVDLLTTALGENAVPACTYDFSSVTDVASFLTTARVLEGVGVSAYLGAAKNISNSTYLETAGSILTVEGRHASYLIAQTNDGGNAIPGPFDTPLDFKEVYSLAAPFIQECPQNATLPITSFPALNLTGGAANGSFTPGQQVTVAYEANSTSGNSSYLALIQGVAQPQFLQLEGNSSQVTLPSNLTGGQMYAVVTSDNSGVTDDNTIAGPAVGYVNIPLPQAPEATNSSSSSSSSSSSASGGSTATGSAGAAPTGSASSAASASATASGSDSIVSTESASATATGSQSLLPSLASLGSANIPTPTSSA